MSDHELLQAYTQQGSEQAFAELVRRYLDLVYAAARRQVRAPHLAEEVTQNVFIDLARSARKLNPSQPLAAWLFLVTRRKAIDLLRSETRSHSRTELINADVAENVLSASGQIEPLLDEAVASLGEEYRRALILRFFENRSLREVGDILGASEAAAQKRVSRAFEQLRAYFGKRGVVLGAAAVATQISAQAVVPAPAALAASVSSIAALTGVTIQVSQILLMTTAKKMAFSAALALSAGVALYEARELSLIKKKARGLEERMDALAREANELRAQREIALKRLASTESELAAFKDLGAGDPAIESALEAWLDRVTSLSKWLEKMPDKRIPEMALLTEDDWLEAAKNAKFGTDFEVRESLAKLRGLALDRFGEPLNVALGRYKKETQNRLPPTPDDLLPFFDPPIDPAILQNYEIVDREWAKFFDMSGNMLKFVLRNKLVGDIFDVRRNYMGSGGAVNEVVNLSRRAIEEAVRDYRRLNNGQSPSDADQITPYLKRSIDPEYLKQALKTTDKVR